MLECNPHIIMSSLNSPLTNEKNIGDQDSWTDIEKDMDETRQKMWHTITTEDESEVNALTDVSQSEHATYKALQRLCTDTNEFNLDRMQCKVNFIDPNSNHRRDDITKQQYYTELTQCVIAFMRSTVWGVNFRQGKSMSLEALFNCVEKHFININNAFCIVGVIDGLCYEQYCVHNIIGNNFGKQWRDFLKECSTLKVGICLITSKTGRIQVVHSHFETLIDQFNEKINIIYFERKNYFAKEIYRLLMIHGGKSVISIIFADFKKSDPNFTIDGKIFECGDFIKLLRSTHRFKLITMKTINGKNPDQSIEVIDDFVELE